MNTSSQSKAVECGADKRIKTRHDCRTYRDLLQLRPSTDHGTCCACHQWNRPTWTISTRASICRECIDRKGDAVLGSIVKAERKARSWIKKFPDSRKQPKRLVHITGASLEFIEAEIARFEKAGK